MVIMPMHNTPNSSTNYYIIERTTQPLDKRFLHTLGRTPVPGDGQALSQQPRWFDEEHAFRFDTYSAACHWLARWTPTGTHRLIYVDQDNGDCKYVMDGPVDLERFDERDWREYHHMNGKSN